MHMVDTVITLPPNELQDAIASMPSLQYLKLTDEPNAVYTAPIINALEGSRMPAHAGAVQSSQRPGSLRCNCDLVARLVWS